MSCSGRFRFVVGGFFLWEDSLGPVDDGSVNHEQDVDPIRTLRVQISPRAEYSMAEHVVASEIGRPFFEDFGRYRPNRAVGSVLKSPSIIRSKRAAAGT